MCELHSEVRIYSGSSFIFLSLPLENGFVHALQKAWIFFESSLPGLKLD